MKGRAEPVRLALTIGGIGFEDKRLTGEEVAAMKPTLPYGQVPIMEVDGEVIAQGMGLLYYAGKLTGLYPEDPLKALKVDEILGVTEDISGALRPSFYEQDEAKKLEMRKQFSKETLPKWFGNMEKRIKGWGTQYSATDELTIADLVLYVQGDLLRSGILDGIPKDVLDAYPKLTEIIDKVGAHPKVQEWNAAH